jgi:hypothetical protein
MGRVSIWLIRDMESGLLFHHIPIPIEVWGTVV